MGYGTGDAGGAGCSDDSGSHESSHSSAGVDEGSIALVVGVSVHPRPRDCAAPACGVAGSSSPPAPPESKKRPQRRSVIVKENSRARSDDGLGSAHEQGDPPDGTRVAADCADVADCIVAEVYCVPNGLPGTVAQAARERLCPAWQQVHISLRERREDEVRGRR